jgi:hypothetical protein
MPPTARKTAAKPPQDHKPKGATRRPQVTGSGEINEDGSYTWTSSAGEAITVPDPAALSAGFLRANRKLSDIDLIFTVFEELLEEDELEKLDRLSVAEVNRLFAEWQGASGVSIPQS